MPLRREDGTVQLGGRCTGTEHPSMSQKLTPKLVRKLYPEQNSKEVEKLQLSNQGLTEVGDLSTLRKLKRLDLAQNSIQSTSFAATCTGLKWLSLAHNPVSDLSPLICLQNLQVLNVGHAKLSGKVKIGAMTSLGALILNDNALTSISGLKEVKGLNTLVLKNNAFTNLGASLHHCTALSKLSMAHNQLSDLGSSLQGCSALRELRLNHNALTALPQGLTACQQLRIVDLAGNPIAALQPIKVLAQLPNLQNLTLKGGPLAEQQGYPGTVKEQLPQLLILDSHRLYMSGTPSKQAAKAGHSAADVSLPGKGSHQPPATGDTAFEMIGSTGTRLGAQPKLAHSSEHPDSSDKQLAGPQVQAAKRKSHESAPAATETAAGMLHHTSEEPVKKLKATGSAASPAIETLPSAHAQATAGPTVATSKAKARRKQAAEASLRATGASGQIPKAELGNVEDFQVLGATSASGLLHSSGAEPSGRVITDAKTGLRAGSSSSRQRKAASAAPKQKFAKQPSTEAKQPANGSHAFATGKKAAMLLQQEVVGNPLAGPHDPAWSWAAAGEHEAPMSTWS